MAPGNALRVRIGTSGTERSPGIVHRFAVLGRREPWIHPDTDPPSMVHGPRPTCTARHVPLQPPGLPGTAKPGRRQRPWANDPPLAGAPHSAARVPKAS